MKSILTLTLLLCLVFTITGCFDRIETMSPGETIELDPVTYGDEYVIDSCRVTRLAPDGAVLINANSLTIFSDADENINEARVTYLTKTAQVEGLVTEVNDYDFIRDDVEITIGNEKVSCELADQFTAEQLHGILGKTRTLKGTIYYISSSRVRMQDCEFVQVR